MPRAMLPEVLGIGARLQDLRRFERRATIKQLPAS
jgi:hypothetical protein